MTRKRKLDKLHTRKIVGANYDRRTGTVTVRFDDDDIAAVAVDALKFPDGAIARIRSVRLDEFHTGIEFVLSNGETHDVAGDLITWLTRPEYAAEYPADDALGPRIAANVTRLRKERGLSQLKLAAGAKMQAPNLSRLEAGKHVPGLNVLLRVANALDVPLSALLTKAPRARESRVKEPRAKRRAG